MGSWGGWSPNPVAAFSGDMHRQRNECDLLPANSTLMDAALLPAGSNGASGGN